MTQLSTPCCDVFPPQPTLITHVLKMFFYSTPYILPCDQKLDPTIRPLPHNTATPSIYKTLHTFATNQNGFYWSRFIDHHIPHLSPRYHQHSLWYMYTGVMNVHYQSSSGYGILWYIATWLTKSQWLIYNAVQTVSNNQQLTYIIAGRWNRSL